jgi:tetratricopeptide (TPR) repeat protein
MSRFREAYPLLDDPARQMPRWLLRQFATERMQAEDGPFDALATFLQAITYGLEPGDEELAGRVVAWLQQRCMTGEVPRREATARAAMAALPGVDWPVLALTAVLRRDGRVADAEAMLATSVGRGSGDLWFRWGIQLSTLLRYDEAISAYDEALRRGPGPGSPWTRGAWLHSESLLFRGLAHQQSGRTKAADQDLRQAARVAPQDPRIHYSLGRLAVQNGDADEAWAHFATALTVESGFSPARLGLGLLRELAGRPAEAVAHYQAARRFDSNSWPAAVRLGVVLLAAGRVEEAEAILRPAAGHSYWGAMAAFHFGLTRLRAGDPIGALDPWERLRSNDLRDWTALAHDHAARKHLAEGDPTAARLQWQLALLDAPEVEARRSALREAALREAAELLLSGRDAAENQQKALASLDLASSLAGGAAGALADSMVDTVTTEAPSAAEPAAAADADPGAGIRHDRLTALIALAGGSTVRVQELLDPAGGLRDLLHLAAAALADGRPERAEELLARLEPDPDCDPALARLRALVAEREEHWADAVLWYQRFLENDVEGTHHEAEPGEADGEGASAATVVDSEDFVDTDANTLSLDVRAIARAGKSGAQGDEAAAGDREGPLCATSPEGACSHFSVQACGGCGREGCATHLYRPDGVRTYRCERCASPVLQAILFCARKAEVLGKAELTLAAWAEAMHEAGTARTLRRHLALLRAEAGDLDGALVWLPSDAVQERVNLLIRRAAAAVDRGEPFQAVGDLRQALRLEPGQPEAIAALEALAEYEARQHALEGRDWAAFDGYLALVRQDPSNPRLLHALGLTAWRMARGGNPAHWPWAIGGLVSALYAPNLWTDVARVNGRPGAGAAQIAEARETLLGELREDLRRVDVAARRGPDDVNAWTVRLGTDIFAGELYAKEDLTLEELTAFTEDGDLVVASPALDHLLRQQAETPGLAAWRTRAAALHAVDPDRPRDRDRAVPLFGRWGPHHFLYEDGRFTAAISALDSVPEADRDADWTSLLRHVLVLRGMELHLEERWREALQCISRSVSLAPEDEEPDSVLVEVAAESGRNEAQAVLQADPNDWRGVVELLEMSVIVARNVPEVRAELSAAHIHLARADRAAATDYVPALAHVRRALELTPDDVPANELLRVVLAERAGLLTRPGPDNNLLEAVQWWQELSEIAPEPAYRSGLARALRLLSRSAALAGRRALALDRMAWALLADPEWDGDAREEAADRLATFLFDEAMAGAETRPFDERAHILRTTLSYRDTPDLREVMIVMWRSQAIIQFDARYYAVCEALLEEAMYLGGDPDTGEKGPLPFAGPAPAQGGGIPATVRPSNWRRYPQARSLIKRTLNDVPSDDELRGLQQQINDLR